MRSLLRLCVALLILGGHTIVFAAPLALTIPQLQGEGMESPYQGQQVSVHGVVTGVVVNGFFIQDAQGDNNPNTSDGVFVYTKEQPTVKRGNSVSVVGEVTEHYGQTQINSTNRQVTVSASYRTVSATLLSLPMSNAVQWEHYEGMLVKADNLVVAETYQLARYGQISLAPNRLWAPTQIKAPGDAANALASYQALSQIMLDDGSDAQNPDPVQYAGFGALSYANPIRSGYTLPSLQGVVRYAYGNYLVFPVDDVNFIATNSRQAHAKPAEVGGNIKVASFNVLNYFTTLDNGTNQCGPQLNQDCRGANTTQEFMRQQTKIVQALNTIQADIFGLMEIENNATLSLQHLVSALNAVSIRQYAYVDAGVVGSDAIKLGLIYRTDSVELVGDVKILDYQDRKNRPALIQTFQPKDNKNNALQFTVVVNHLKSKGSSCSTMSYSMDDKTVKDVDKKDGQGHCNITRQQAIKKLLAYLQTNPTQVASDQHLLIGDFNSYAMEDPITLLKQAGYTDLANQANNSAYSYIYNGQLGTLDYAFANANLAKRVTGTTLWHINADEPAGFDYDMTYKKAAQDVSYYAATAFRSSDHDPVIVGLNLGDSIPTMSTNPIRGVEKGNKASRSGGGALSYGDLLLLLGIALLSRRVLRRNIPRCECF